MIARFVIVADSHYHPTADKNWGPPYMLDHSKAVMEAMITEINAVEPDFIIHEGDLLCGGGGSFCLSVDDYYRSVEDAGRAFSMFQAPVYFVPGNHDCDPQTGSFASLSERISMPEILDVVDVAPRLRLAIANVYTKDPLEIRGGTWTSEHDCALAKAAKQAFADKCAIILALHSTVLPAFGDNEMTQYKGVLDNSEKLIETISRHPAIVATTSGHSNMNRIKMYRNFLSIETACLVGYPMGFREIELREDGYLVAKFHQLSLHDLCRKSYDRSTPEKNMLWHGDVYDRETEILLPRLQELWEHDAVRRQQ